MDEDEASSADLLGIGTHCSVGSCGQLDFLPFTCDCCQRVFCLEHRSYAGHACPKAGSKETEVIVCPLCAKAVRLEPGQDANLVFERHAREGCDPSNYAKVHKKPRCPVAGCKEKLTTINAYRCKDCGQRVCLPHRHPVDHKCQEARAANAATAAAASGNPLARFFGHTSAPPAAAPAPAPRPAPPQAVRSVQQYDQPSNSVKGTVGRRMAAPPASANARHAPSPRPEECPQCGASFASVERLIQHVEEWHPSGGSSSSGAGSRAGGVPASAAPGTVANPLHGLAGSTIAGGAGAGAMAGQPPASASAPGLGLGMGMPLFGGSSSAARRQQQQQQQQQQAAAGQWQGAQGGRGNAAGQQGQVETFRCHFCSQTFHDPVLLVQHADRCGAARAAAEPQSGDGSSKDRCIIV